MTLYSFKTYDRIIVKLKAIKYKKDFFCYLSFYLILQTLTFRPYAFRLLF